MNEKITFPALVNLLALKSGAQRKACEDFLKEFFNVLVETLAEGENVRIKGLGLFKVVAVEPRKSVNVNTGEQFEIPGHRKIVFVPAKELAEDINSPFAMFESVELPDNFTETEELEKIESTENEISQPEPEKQSDSVPQQEEGVTSTEQQQEEEVPSGLEQEEEAPSEPAHEEASSEPEAELQPAEPNQEVDASPEIEQEEEEEAIENDDYDYSPGIVATGRHERKKNFRFLLGFIAGVAFTALLALAFYIFILQKWEWKATQELVKEETAEEVQNQLAQLATESSDSITEQTNVLQSDSIQSEVEEVREKKDEEKENIAPTQPSDKPVYDTISKTRYLTTMAKEHYGNYNLWPYIYEENKSFLGHPDRIRPGTRVVIPSLSKYGVDPSNPDHIKKAKQKGVEIYSRFKN